VFPATVNATEPLPTPFAPAPIVIHGTVLAAVHAHPPVVDTCIEVPGPPLADVVWVVGAIAYVHVAAASWETVTARPATVTEPLRATPVLGATVSVTLPPPVLGLPDGMVIQDALLAAVHEQPVVVATVKGPVPPDAPTFTFAGVTVKLQGVAAS